MCTLSLNEFVAIVLRSPNLGNTTNQYFIQAAFTIPQLATFNTTVLKKISSAQLSHTTRREPIPVSCTGQFLH